MTLKQILKEIKAIIIKLAETIETEHQKSKFSTEITLK
jgi:hypothetical protein